MKKISLYTIIIATTSLMMITSCLDTDLDGIVPVSENAKSLPDKTNAYDPTIEPKGLHGKTITDWTKEWWRYVMSFDCANNPLNLPYLSSPATQLGQVVFLVGTNDGMATRNIEVSGEKALFVPIINVLRDYPGAYLHGLPAPGQSVEQFLKIEAANYINQATNMKAVLDGRIVKITKQNRFATDQFYFKSNKDLKNCMDATLTGQPQVAVSDGYWIILQKLNPGRHTLRVHAEILQTGIVIDVVYNLFVR
ncbi:MAG: hypothetical protein ABIQ02_12360 [Saprospiraceae bacterium]